MLLPTSRKESPKTKRAVAVGTYSGGAAGPSSGLRKGVEEAELAAWRRMIRERERAL